MQTTTTIIATRLADVTAAAERAIAHHGEHAHLSLSIDAQDIETLTSSGRADAVARWQSYMDAIGEAAEAGGASYELKVDRRASHDPLGPMRCRLPPELRTGRD